MIRDTGLVSDLLHQNILFGFCNELEPRNNAMGKIFNKILPVNSEKDNEEAWGPNERVAYNVVQVCQVELSKKVGILYRLDMVFFCNPVW